MKSDEIEYVSIKCKHYVRWRWKCYSLFPCRIYLSKNEIYPLYCKYGIIAISWPKYIIHKNLFVESIGED